VVEAPSQEKIEANVKKEASYSRHEEVEAAVERAREVFEIVQVGREGRRKMQTSISYSIFRQGKGQREGGREGG